MQEDVSLWMHIRLQAVTDTSLDRWTISTDRLPSPQSILTLSSRGSLRQVFTESDGRHIFVISKGPVIVAMPFHTTSPCLYSPLISGDRVLNPGGWVQLVEIYFNVQSDNGSITEKHALREWSTRYMGSFEPSKDLRVGTRLRNLLLAEGLTEVDARMIPLPLSAWSTGKLPTFAGHRISPDISQIPECGK